MTRVSLIPLFMCLTLGAASARAQSAEDLHLTVGKSVVIDYPSDIRQVYTSNPEVADVNTVTTREMILSGKGVGASTLMVWSKTGQRTFYNITVELNLDPLKRAFRESFPNEKIVPVSSRDAITLDGQVSSKDVQDRAALIAASFGKTVVNNLQLNAPPAPPVERQILLRVRFAELDRSKEMQYGVNLFGLGGQTQIGAGTGQFSATSVTGTSEIQGGGGTLGSAGGGTLGNSTISISKALSIFAFDPNLNLGAFIQALQSENILETLAEPNLVTTNGKEASFLVGGQFPVPVLQGGANSGAVTVQYREYGIKLVFLPLVTPNHTIKMHLHQEVSTLDYTNAVTLNGFTIPALSSRDTDTDVELGEGQSFVISGLVSNQETEQLQKIPILGSLPIFGALFKSKQEQKNRTDLVVLVTPEITQPLGASDTKPTLYMPRDFLVRLTQDQVAQASKKK
ncbi:MAG TPA: pilus assembly protein N-terminal domain-containing protein [Bryobacteraceae bacterium]|nr:pilus assembly protein N-terminal domain-containing protein [Bryobacteraceae bacterium]